VPLDPCRDNEGSVVDGRVEVAVYFGGCGDCRHFFCTLVDAATRCNDLSKLRLRLVLNDHLPEVRPISDYHITCGVPRPGRIYA
jgi:hypothetical protein